MTNQYLFIFFIQLVLICTNLQAKPLSGFDEICVIYTEVTNSSMTADVANKYLQENITKRVTSNDALTLHSIIPQVEPSERYQIFKQSVEESLKRKWECAAMQQLMK